MVKRGKLRSDKAEGGGGALSLTQGGEVELKAHHHNGPGGVSDRVRSGVIVTLFVID